MKIILPLLLSFYFFTVYSQENIEHSCRSQLDSLTQMEVFSNVDKMPTVDGGMQALFKEVASRIKYSNKIDKDVIESKIFVAFIIEEDGTIKGKRIIKNIKGSNLAEQLLEIVSEFVWQPGICDGKPVPTILNLPMIIDLK